MRTRGASSLSDPEASLYDLPFVIEALRFPFVDAPLVAGWSMSMLSSAGPKAMLIPGWTLSSLAGVSLSMAMSRALGMVALDLAEV
jgi:hypothetical protein